MKLGILNTDTVKPEFAAKHGEYPDMFAELFHLVDPDISLMTYEVVHGEYPSDIDEVDGYVITGSKLSVYDDIPWINDLKNFVRQLHSEEKKIIGICFGHQLVAEALGGKTGQAETGWCVGVHKNKFTDAAEDYGLTRSEFKIPSNHKDQVLELPPGGKLLARTETCPISAMGLGDHILTFQGHPEFSEGYARALLDMRRKIFGEMRYREAINSFKNETNNSQVASWILDFISR
ncbi:GMP synthase [Gammaproteobacteria bacterium]|nr:GMP synthase [Gammaproteobacteria bacterium]